MIDGMKIFSVTMARERLALDKKITDWLGSVKDKVEIVDKWVRQSSDNEFHCLSFIFAYKFLPTTSSNIPPTTVHRG